jgi:CO dehydrogenase maturation factor
MKIAVSGKGGVGKTTVSAALARLFEADGRLVYGVDADPDASLGMTLGVPEEELVRFKPLVEMKEIIAERVGGEGGMFTLNPKVDDVVESFSLCCGNIRLLKMGSLKKAATSCYCPENSFLNAVMRALVLEQEDVVIMDMSAGIEHLTRGTAQGMDTMLIVTEPAPTSLKTAKVAASLATELGATAVRAVGNKVRGESDIEIIREGVAGLPVLGYLPYDDSVFGAPIASSGTEGKFWEAARQVYTRLREG